MFPYPSGDLHMGHAEVMALHDVIARYWWQRGYDVLNPIGWDSFGLPAENAAIKRDENPAVFTYANIETQAESFRRYGISFDWSRRLNTSDPEYYRWTQWLFLKFRERGLAYRKFSPVNWCPNDQTVLANEQVVAGMCERCGAEVTKRELSQWYFKVTDYAQRLLDDMVPLEETWPSKVLAMQRNWIGRSEGAHVDFAVDAPHYDGDPIRVFTTRPDTVFGATFMVVAADAKIAARICAPERRQAAGGLPGRRPQGDRHRPPGDRPAEVRGRPGRQRGEPGHRRPDPGLGLGLRAGRLRHRRDHGGARPGPARLGVRREVRPADHPDRAAAEGFEEEGGEAFTGTGPAINSANDEISLDGLPVDEAKARIIAWLEEKGAGTGFVNFRLRDWLLSRQRYWGAPIPIVHCDACGEVAVPEDQLPVELPDLSGADLKPKGVSPLAAAEEWVNVDCPQCGGPAKRDSDTMDTFVDSSWYFFRYCSPRYTEGPFDPEAVRDWMPAAQYVGGVEHAILHLLYSRFFTKVLHDMGMIDFVEPFSRLMNQGEVINEGRGMSKSLGNGVNLGDMIDEFGVDAVRLTMVFAGPPEADIDWADMSPAGSVKFLQRAWRLSGRRDLRGRRRRSRAVTSRCGGPRTGPSPTPSSWSRPSASTCWWRGPWSWSTPPARPSTPAAGRPTRPCARPPRRVAILLSLVAPYTAEEMWERLGHQPTVARAGWPTVDPALLVRGLGHRGRADPGQAARQAGGQPGHHRGRPGGAGDGRRPRPAGAGRARTSAR